LYQFRTFQQSLPRVPEGDFGSRSRKIGNRFQSSLVLVTEGDPTMHALPRTSIGFSVLIILATSFASAQSGDWQKTYSVAGKPSLNLSTGDAAVEVHPCGDCRAVKIAVDWRDRRPSDFLLKESQAGDQVIFQLNEKSQIGIHFTMGSSHSPRVTVETPTVLDLELRTADGALNISGVQGNLQLHTSDGAVDVHDVSGTVRLVASDGAIKIHNVTGTLESRSSDGHATIDGKFTALQVHTSDGNLDLTLADGTELNTASRVESSDGHVTVHLPRTMAVDLDIHTGDGHINCTLPVMVEGYNSNRESGHNLRGHLNGGGIPLTVHTSDGNVTINSL
jgi:hypothetical protein